MTKKLNIVYCVFQCNNISGGIRIIFEQANRLHRRGHHVEIWTLAPFNGIAPYPIEVPIIQIPCEYDFESQILLKLHYQSTRALEPDVYIAVSHPTAFGYSSVPEAKPYWYLQHDESVTFIDLPNKAQAELVKRSYLEALHLPINLLTNSHWTQAELKSKYGVRSTIIGYGIDRTVFSPTESLHLNNNKPTILSVYSDLTWKGMADLSKAMDKIYTSFPEVRLMLISASRPKNISANPPIYNFTSPSQSDMKTIYCSATIFVSPSWSEGFGLPGLEAMACGTPVVTTNSGGVLEYASTSNGQTALVVPPRQPKKLSEAMIKLLTDKSLRTKLIANGLKKAEGFDWDNVIDNLERELMN